MMDWYADIDGIGNRLTPDAGQAPKSQVSLITVGVRWQF
jgi:hypothetical protein